PIARRGRGDWSEDEPDGAGHFAGAQDGVEGTGAEAQDCRQASHQSQDVGGPAAAFWPGYLVSRRSIRQLGHRAGLQAGTIVWPALKPPFTARSDRAFHGPARIGGRPMKYLLSAVIALGSLGLALAAFAQSASPSSTPTVQTSAAPAAPVSPSKRYACRAASQAAQGQDRQDQMQLCMAQARMDCLKQAIDQRIVGPQRREFVRTCVGG